MVVIEISQVYYSIYPYQKFDIFWQNFETVAPLVYFQNQLAVTLHEQQTKIEGQLLYIVIVARCLVFHFKYLFCFKNSWF